MPSQWPCGNRRQTDAEIHVVFTQQTNQRSGNRLPDAGVATAGIPCCSTRKL